MLRRRTADPAINNNAMTVRSYSLVTPNCIGSDLSSAQFLLWLARLIGAGAMTFGVGFDLGQADQR